MDDADQKLESGDESLRHRVRGAVCSVYVKMAVTQSVLQALISIYFFKFINKSTTSLTAPKPPFRFVI